MKELTGSEAQVEWAERIRLKVNDEFDRVARAFQTVAAGQSAEERADTELVIGILEEKRREVLDREQAGYFIKQWQEMGDQVRLLIFRDPRYEEIKRRRVERQEAAR